MAAKQPKFIFRWRDAFTSASGPKPHTLHVLWALSKFVPNDGGEVFPSIETLAAITGLKEKAVGVHLTKAVSAGWITRRKPRIKGKDWSQYFYMPVIPPGYVAPVTNTDANDSAEVAGAAATVSRAIGAVNDDHLHQSAAPTNSVVDSINNSKKNSAEFFNISSPTNPALVRKGFKEAVFAAINKRKMESALNMGFPELTRQSHTDNQGLLPAASAYSNARAYRALRKGHTCPSLHERSPERYIAYTGHSDPDFWIRSHSWRMKK